MEAKRVEREANLEVMRDVVRDQAFKGSFGPYDLLWFGLAMYTAFSVGKGSAPETTAAAKPEAAPEGSATPPEPPATDSKQA